MPKLPQVRSREAVNALKSAGFSVDRQSGSHVTLKKPGHRLVVTVPMHTKPLKEGTLRAIIKQAGLTVEEFLDHLGR